MPHSYEQVRQIAHELPEDERALLATSLWESVEADGADISEAEVDASWDAEIGRRVAEIKAGTAVTYSWEEVEAALRAKLGK
jgi:putative addiction module component (TIGR02574 family)